MFSSGFYPAFSFSSIQGRYVLDDVDDLDRFFNFHGLDAIGLRLGQNPGPLFFVLGQHR